jgi:molybdopterin converting factor small subunit
MENEEMTISAAIKAVKELRAKLGRLISMQKANFCVVIPVDAASLQDAIASGTKVLLFPDLEEQIQDCATRIVDLREAVDRTAHVTTVSVDGKPVTLARLRMLLEGVRYDISRVSNLTDRAELFGARSRRLTVDDKEREVNQLDATEIEALLDKLIQRKQDLDAILEKANVNTILARRD